jgi:putative acyl-CoA dehydrogenase
MVNYTRMDCALGSAALMRAAIAQAIHHAAHRRTFGALLIEHSLMRNVLADLALESEAATVLCMRLARAIDESVDDAQASALKRLGTALAKYYLCKRASVAVGEALECLGGNGYVEESIMPRLYREAPLNSIWEGSGNINALDVLRILRKQPAALAAWREEIAPVEREPVIARAVERLERDLRAPELGEAAARDVSERMALLWQAALLVQYAPASVSDAFLASRIAGDWGRAFGTLPRHAALREIVERAAPLPQTVAA